MKKKKSNIKEKLQKLKKPLMILSIIGNVLFALFLIIGFVGSAKQKQQNKQNNSQVTRLLKRSGDATTLVTLQGTTWALNDSIEYIPINNVGQVEISTNRTQNTNIDFYVNEDNDVIFNHIRFTGQENTSYYKGVLGTKDNSVSEVVLYQNATSHYQKQVNVETITIVGGSSQYNIYLIDWFYQNASLLNDIETLPSPFYFNFARQCNFNAPYNTNTTSAYVNTQESAQTSHIYISLPMFLSNGEAFDRIHLLYERAHGTYYKDPKGTIYLFEDTSYLYHYFVQAQFENTQTGLKRTAFYRNVVQFNNNNGLAHYIDNSVTWKNNAYQRLVFGVSPNANQKTNLAQFNNFDKYNGSYNGEAVTITNAFEVINGAFNGIMPLMRVEILPNITIGLLVFLPLIAGVILTIIWVVKR